MKTVLEIAVVVAIAILIILVLSAHFWAPCEIYRWTTAKDVPTRCLVEYTR